MAFTNEKIVPHLNNESIKGTEFKSTDMRILYKLAHTGAISPHPDLKGVIPKGRWFYPEGSFTSKEAWIVNKDKAVEVFEGCRVGAPETKFPEGREQELFERSQKAVKQSIRAFVKNGDIPPSLAVTVGRLLRPSNIKVTREDYARFLYLGHSFPTTPEERASLEVGLEYAFGQVNVYKEMLAENGVNLTEDQIIDLILRDGISHEYGHAVHSTLSLIQYGEYISKLPEGERGKKSFWDIREELEQRIFDTIAPNQDLANLLLNEPDEDSTKRSRTSSERVGRGFQYLGSRYVLQDFGVDPTKIDAVIETFRIRHDKVLVGYKRIIEEIRARNLNIALFSYGLNDVLSALREMKREDLQKILHFGFGARDLGYYYPLTQDQIRSFVRESWLSNVVIDEKINQAMDKAGGITLVIT